MRAKHRGRRNPDSPRTIKRLEKDNEVSESSLDFLLNHLSFGLGSKGENLPVIRKDSEINKHFDYNFIQTGNFMIIVLIMIVLLAGMLLVLSLLT